MYYSPRNKDIHCKKCPLEVFVVQELFMSFHNFTNAPFQLSRNLTTQEITIFNVRKVLWKLFFSFASSVKPHNESTGHLIKVFFVFVLSRALVFFQVVARKSLFDLTSLLRPVGHETAGCPNYLGNASTRSPTA